MNELNYNRELRGYLTGFVLALAFTLGPFALVAWGNVGWSSTLIILGVCALAQLIVQLRFFLHITLAQEKREDLQLILFSLLLLIIMAGGTIWVIANMATRM